MDSDPSSTYVTGTSTTSKRGAGSCAQRASNVMKGSTSPAPQATSMSAGRNSSKPEPVARGTCMELHMGYVMARESRWLAILRGGRDRGEDRGTGRGAN